MIRNASSNHQNITLKSGTSNEIERDQRRKTRANTPAKREKKEGLRRAPALCPGAICEGELVATPRAEEVLLPAALEVKLEPGFWLGLEGAACEGEEDAGGEGEGVGVLTDVKPTEIVGVGAVAVDVATTTL